MIPKIIHYVWVGDQQKPQTVLDCIDSWEKNLSDYQFVEWGNSEHEQIKNAYSESAFKHKKWAFVSDYVRVHALYHIGGIYLDTDVVVSNSFDQFLSHRFFSGFENFHEKISPITTAVMGAVPRHEIMKDLLDDYNTSIFERKHGLNLQTNTSRFTNYFEKKYGISGPHDQYDTLHLTETDIIYPSYFFCLENKEFTNYARHNFDASWQEAYSRRVKFKIGPFELVRFKKNIHSEKTELPLGDKERIILKIFSKKQKIFAITRKAD